MKFIWYTRHNLARFLIHTGLWVMPEGRAKRDIMTMLWNWRIHVEDVVRKHEQQNKS